MRRHGSPAELERIRRKAIELHEQGMEFSEVALAVDRSVRSVQAWVKQFREQGASALQAKPHPGRVPLLSAVQREDLRQRLIAGARASRWTTDLWTAPRVRELIRKQYRVTYHVRYVPQVLRALGFSCQKPQRPARQRDPAAVQRWITRDWERIKKKRAA